MKKLNVLGLVFLFSFAFMAQTTYANVRGCTPGYWKNHLEQWVYYTPEMTLAQAFECLTPGQEWFWPAQLSDLGDDTLLEALNYKGGPGIEGAARNMLRQSVAALLNAAHPQVNYFGEDGEEYVKMLVRWALHYLDERTNMLFIKDFFEYYNELGSPLCVDYY